MPRLPRLELAGVPLHIVQRGNDRQPCFFSEEDYSRYVKELRELCLREDCQVHAYVLMTNHVHLLVTPLAAGRIAKVMQSLGRRYVRYLNDRHHRTGTLWEGRYKSCLADSETYLLQCYRYIELNPVRAGMVAATHDYRWSSHQHNAFGKPDTLVQPHPLYLSLGDTEAERFDRYRDLFIAGEDPNETQAIRLNLQRQHALGSNRFRIAIERQLERRAGPAKIGRPRKSHAVGEIAL